MKFEAKEGDRVDLLVWAHTGRDKVLTERLVDKIPGLAKIMFDLPIGYEIKVPDELLKPAPKPITRLW